MDKLSNKQPPDLRDKKKSFLLIPHHGWEETLLVSHSQAQRDEAAGLSKGRAHEETSEGRQGWEHHFHTQFTVAPPHPGPRRAVQELRTLSWGPHLSIGKSCLRAALLGLPSGEESSPWASWGHNGSRVPLPPGQAQPTFIFLPG